MEHQHEGVNPASGVRHSASDCRAEHGVTVGLIDSIVSVARVLASRDLITSTAVAEALHDLATDEDVRHLFVIGSAHAEAHQRSKAA